MVTFGDFFVSFLLVHWLCKHSGFDLDFQLSNEDVTGSCGDLFCIAEIGTGKNTESPSESRAASTVWTLRMKSGSLCWLRARPEVARILFGSKAVPWCTGNPLSVLALQKT